MPRLHSQNHLLPCMKPRKISRDKNNTLFDHEKNIKRFNTINEILR